MHFENRLGQQYLKPLLYGRRREGTPELLMLQENLVPPKTTNAT